MWHAIVGALLPDAGDTLGGRAPAGHVRRRGRPDARHHAGRREPARLARAAASCEARRSTTPIASVAAATATLAALEERGWSTLVDQPLGMPSGRLGADAVAERTEAFDPIAVGGPGAAEAADGARG